MGLSRRLQVSHSYVPLKHVYLKSCHFLVEVEHKAMWTLIKLNFDRGATSGQRVNDMNDLDEFRLKAYESLDLYKDNMKKYHDQNIDNIQTKGELVF